MCVTESLLEIKSFFAKADGEATWLTSEATIPATLEEVANAEKDAIIANFRADRGRQNLLKLANVPSRDAHPPDSVY